MSNFASRIIRTKGNKLLVPRHKRSTNDSYHKAVTDASGIVFEEFLQHVKIQEATSKKKKLDIWIHILSFIDDKKDTILSFIDDKKNIILSFMDDKGTDKSIVITIHSARFDVNTNIYLYPKGCALKLQR